MQLGKSLSVLGWLALAAGACSSPAEPADVAPQPQATDLGGATSLAGAGGGSSAVTAGVSSGGNPGSSAGGVSGSAGAASGGGGGVGSGMSSGGAAGVGGNAGDSNGGSPGAGKLTLTVDGIPMGDRLCFKPEASNSGGNHSPKMAWSGVPEGTRSLVLTMYDQTNTTPHRIVCNLAPTLMEQAADIKTMVPDGAQVSTGHSKPGNAWYGPGAGGNAHAYEIAIWALSTPLLEGGCNMSGADATRAVYNKLKSAPPTLVLASDAKVLWGSVDGRCTP